MCVCMFCVYSLFMWKGVKVDNISSTQTKILLTFISSRKEDAPNQKLREEDEFTQISPSNEAKLFWSPRSDVTETDWRTFILVSLHDKTTHSDLVVVSRCFGIS